MKKIIKTDNAPAPIGPYSQAVQAGNLLFVSGQIAIDPKDGQMKMNDIIQETNQVMNNIGTILDVAGYAFSDIIKTTIFLKDMKNFQEVNETYGSYFKDNFPARETVEVSELPKNVNVEISVTAYRT